MSARLAIAFLYPLNSAAAEMATECTSVRVSNVEIEIDRPFSRPKGQNPPFLAVRTS